MQRPCGRRTRGPGRPEVEGGAPQPSLCRRGQRRWQLLGGLPDPSPGRTPSQQAGQAPGPRVLHLEAGRDRLSGNHVAHVEDVPFNGARDHGCHPNTEEGQGECASFGDDVQGFLGLRRPCPSAWSRRVSEACAEPCHGCGAPGAARRRAGLGLTTMLSRGEKDIFRTCVFPAGSLLMGFSRTKGPLGFSTEKST